MNDRLILNTDDGAQTIDAQIVGDECLELMVIDRIAMDGGDSICALNRDQAAELAQFLLAWATSEGT